MNSHVIFCCLSLIIKLKNLKGTLLLRLMIRMLIFLIRLDDELVEGNDSVELDDEVENQGVVVKEWKEYPSEFKRQDQD